MAHIAQFDVWIPNDTEEAREVQERIVGLMEQNAWPMRDCFGVRLALEGPGTERVLDGLDGEAARELTGVVTAHAVGHHEETAVARHHVAVFVSGADDPDIGAGGAGKAHSANQKKEVEQCRDGHDHRR